MEKKIKLEIWYLKQQRAQKKLELFNEHKTQGQIQEIHREIYAIEYSLQTLKRIMLKDGIKTLSKNNS